MLLVVERKGYEYRGGIQQALNVFFFFFFGFVFYLFPFVFEG